MSVSQIRSNQVSAEWTEIGPKGNPINLSTRVNGIGRIQTVAFHPTDSATIYVGSISSGAWKSTDHGDTWIPLTDDFITNGVSAIAVSPINPNVIYIGTGDRDEGPPYGEGLFKSTDGGQSFTHLTGDAGDGTIGKVVIHPLNDSIVLFVGNGGVYRSTNAGATWSRRGGIIHDIMFNPADPNLMYATHNTWTQFMGSYYISENGGLTWNSVPLQSNYLRVTASVCATHPNIVYVLAGSQTSIQAIYLSVDSGRTFNMQGTSQLNFPAFYVKQDITVDNFDPGKLFFGGANIYKTEDSAFTFQQVSNFNSISASSVPTSHFTLETSPITNNLYSCNSGGLSFSQDGGSTWVDLNGDIGNAHIEQFSQSPTDPVFLAAYHSGFGTALRSDSSWLTRSYGAGLYTGIDQLDDNNLYFVNSSNKIKRSTNRGKTTETVLASGTNGFNTVIDNGLFLLSPHSSEVMFAGGGGNIYRTMEVRSGAANSVNWTKISQSTNIGSSSSDVKGIIMSDTDSSLIYVSKENGTLWRSYNTLDPTPTWTRIDTNFSNTNSHNVIDMVCHPHDTGTIYAIRINYLFKSDDYGLSWSDISGSIPRGNNYKYAVALDPSSVETIYLGTRDGVYFKNLSMTDWIKLDGLPRSVRVADIEVYNDSLDLSESRVRVSMAGRGIWERGLVGSPKAKFNLNGYLGCAPDTVILDDWSGYSPDVWSWQISGTRNFSSSMQSPSFVFDTAGTYNIRLIASNSFGSDTIEKQYEIGTKPDIDGLTTNERCFNSGDGSIAVSITKGVMPFTYLWSDGNTMEDRVNLSSGNYTLVATGNDGCFVSDQFSISDSAQILIATSSSFVTCFNSSNGAATAVASANNTPLTYHWNTSPVQTSNLITGIAGGSYEVTVTDINGCTKTSSVNVFEPSELTVYLLPDFPAVGQMQVLVTGGIAPYNYNWSTGATTQEISGMPPGFYFCQVSDFNSCAKTPAVTYSGAKPIQQFSQDYINREQDLKTDFLSLYPNPSSGNISLHFEPKDDGIFHIEVLNSIGKTVYYREVNAKSMLDLELDLGHLQSALYYIQISGLESSLGQKILIYH